MRRALGILAGLLAGLSGATAAAEKPPLQHDMMGVANGCFVESVAFLDHWQEALGGDAWARMLVWGAKEDEEVVTGHAVAVAESRGKLWCFDINHGFKPLTIDAAQRETVDTVAAPILAKYPRINARFPLYRFDFPQPPGSTAPVADPANQNTSIRDASIVGERLARRRPVNAIRYTYPVGGETKEGAAVIFMFHGRYCVYVPELGTTPFRRPSGGGVENLRLAQQALQRLVPGVTGLRKL